ncbi:hypothetical protein MRS76_19015 [Rhizobiaceae bacterium n13]|uniref:Transmembrane anchored protein n=1 Tax=Ferirhizobium litorale TaxID=2927786 RepID=A0AAE3QFZ7_9HYPH|nr:hypothetical protein [Fererhizobium litorale]MDI7864042.1 hypothetical protein [Fererhizobium litorale]MDI7924475.1 hypothetical protein [Fererhizobium litorale]
MTGQGTAPLLVHEPLVSNRILFRLAVAVTVFALLTLGIGLASSRIGSTIALGGHTESTELFRITIGQDTIALPANAIRFARQRASAPAERIDLYLAWPDMSGYSATQRQRFNDPGAAQELLFMQLSQSTMSRDMSGRLDPIYSHLFDGAAEPGPHGLTLHRLRPDTGYRDEVMLTATRPGKADYVVRCVLPEDESHASNADCQRDIQVGRDLSVLYRFSSLMLADWQRIDERVQSYFEARLTP